MAFNVKKCKLLCITYCKSGVYNIYQANVVSDDISPALALLAEKHLGFTVKTTDFFTLEKQHENYLGVMLDNKLSFDQHIDEMSKKATNLLDLCCCSLHMCSK